MINRVQNILLPPLDKTNNRQWLLAGSLSIGLLLLILISFTWVETAASLDQLHQTKLDKAAHHAQRARKGSQFLSTITFDQIPLFSAWNHGLNVIILFQDISSSFNPKELMMINNNNQLLSSQTIDQLSQQLQHLERDINRCLILKVLFPQQQTKLKSKLSSTDNLIQAIKLINQNNYQVVILLQNSDELRASGGFIGSLAQTELKQGQPGPVNFYDVYDLSGQIKSPLPKQPGASHYLTEGKGLNLTDANWHPDFPTAANKISQLLSQAEIKPDIIVALNQTVIEQILQKIGPVNLPDYQTQLTAENLTQLARQDRSEFFSGDKQKKHFLAAAFKQIKIKLTQLDPKQQKNIAQDIYSNLKQQQILLYSADPQLQSIFSHQRWAGQLQLSDQDELNQIYLVESNVGINKANQGISRQIKIKPNQNQAQLKIKFINHNQPLTTAEKTRIQNNKDLLQADHLGYVNYQRIITLPKIEVTSVQCQGQKLEIEEDRIITNSQQKKFRQTGFLLTVPEQKQVNCLIQLKDTQLSPDQSTTWAHLQQPGI